MLQEVWASNFGEELVLRAVDPRPRYEEAVSRVAERMVRQESDDFINELFEKEAEMPDVGGVTDDVQGEAIAKKDGAVNRDIDDVTPNLCKQMIRDAIQDLASKEDDEIIDLMLWDVLRLAMWRLAPNMNWPSPARVGANANFPRLWQYVCEICDRVSSFDEDAMRVINVRGKVPEQPFGPGALRIRMQKDAI